MLTPKEHRKVEEYIVKGYKLVDPEYLEELQKAAARDKKRHSWPYRISMGALFVFSAYFIGVLVAFFRMLMV